MMAENEDLAIKSITEAVLFQFQVITGLQVQPEPLGRLKITLRANSVKTVGPDLVEGIGKRTEKAPVKTGMEWRMKEPHGKAVAKHSNPESCAGRGDTTRRKKGGR
jgi:hypothetical protein